MKSDLKIHNKILFCAVLKRKEKIRVAIFILIVLDHTLEGSPYVFFYSKKMGEKEK